MSKEQGQKTQHSNCGRHTAFELRAPDRATREPHQGTRARSSKTLTHQLTTLRAQGTIQTELNPRPNASSHSSYLQIKNSSFKELSIGELGTR